MIWTAPDALHCVRLGWFGVWEALRVALKWRASPVRALRFGVFAKRAKHGGVVLHGGILQAEKKTPAAGVGAAGA